MLGNLYQVWLVTNLNFNILTTRQCTKKLIRAFMSLTNIILPQIQKNV